MTTSHPEEDVLYPLTLLRRKAGLGVSGFKVVGPGTIPEPFYSLLVHEGDMTSRLEAFYGGTIALKLLHMEKAPEAYRREVVLFVEDSKLAVEYGAIEINLAAFEGNLRELIVEARLPLGGLLNRFGVEYRSCPKAFIELGADPVMGAHFGAPGATRFFGRSNVLVGAGKQVLATIVEVLRPSET